MLIQVKLTRSVDPARPGPLEAVVTEGRREAGVEIAAGSPVRCWSRTIENGRLRVTCDRVRSGSGSYSFSGMAVGESGEGIGLRVANQVTVPAGAAFVVYVAGAGE
jgi:hypothetical protein